MSHPKISLIILFIVFLLPVGHCQSKGNIFLLVGGYTKPLKDQGIAVYEFNLQNGDLKFRSVTGDIENPSYLAISQDTKTVYAVSEKNEGQGTVTAYNFDHKNGKLNFINQASSGGEGPCYVSSDDAGTHVFAANYGSGSLAAIRLNKDGSLDPATVQSIQHAGSSINKESQSRPHVHSTVLSPDNKYLLSADLGTDRVYMYRFDSGSTAASLSPATNNYATTKPGSGPRHICFHPNGRVVYVVNEISGSVDAFGYKEGILTFKQSITMLPDNFTGIIEAADIHISPDGKFLYASNRDVRNEIVIYSVDEGGVLRIAGRQPVLGAVPRNFVIDPSGKFLLVANQKTNEVIVFRRNAVNGLLKYTGKKIAVRSPACLKFL
ncbi:MAG: lactonase family protein [Bacteroidota bacterium]